MLFTSDPESEVLVDDVRVDNNLLNFLHEFQPKVTILKDNPDACLETLFDSSSGDLFLPFTHGDLLTKLLPLLFRKIID